MKNLVVFFSLLFLISCGDKTENAEEVNSEKQTPQKEIETEVNQAMEMLDDKIEIENDSIKSEIDNAFESFEESLNQI